MPPDITAGLSTAAGLMPLAGTPPGVIGAGKPPSLSALFASLLAQSGAPTLTQPVPKDAVPRETPPTETPPAETGTAPGLQTFNALPVLTPPALGIMPHPIPKQAAPESPKPLSGSLKTMDTLPELSVLPTENEKAKAGELPLHKNTVHKDPAGEKAPAQTPSAAAQTAVMTAVPVLLPPVTLLTPQLSAAVPVSNAPLLGQAPPSLRGVPEMSPAEMASGNMASVNMPPSSGLPQPRTFALTAPTAAALPIPPSAAAELPLVAESLFQGQPISSGKPSVPVTVKLSVASLSQAGPAQADSSVSVPLSTMTDTPGTVQTASQMPAADALPVSALPSITQSIPAPAVVSSSPVLPAAIGQNQAPPVTAPNKAAGNSTENALKPGAGNADNNTRTLPAAMPITASKTASEKTTSEKHGEAQADPVPLDGTLAGTQTAATAAPTESKPLSAADRTEMVRQVAEGVGAMPLPARPGAAQQMSLQLHPKDWGSLQVSVTVMPGTDAGSAKTVTAHIVAETPQVKAALESQTGALTQSLRASGLHLNHVTVSVKPPDAKMPEVKAASQSASAGMSSGQGNTGSQPDMARPPGANTAHSQAQAGPSSSFASFAGSSQNGRQGQPPASMAASVITEPEMDEPPRENLPLGPARSRIDTRA